MPIAIVLFRKKMMMTMRVMLIFICFLVPSMQAMMLPESERGRSRRLALEKRVKDEQEKLVCAKSNGYVSGLVNPGGLTTPERYGSTLSTKEFDRLAYEDAEYIDFWGSRVFHIGGSFGVCSVSSDHVLCTERQYSFSIRKMAHKYLLLKSIEGLSEDVLKEEIGQHFVLLLKHDIAQSPFYPSKEYAYYIKHAKLQADKCIESVERKIAGLHPWNSDKDLKAVLAKLRDDKYMLEHDGLNEQNIIRSFQLCPTVYPICGDFDLLLTFCHDYDRTKVIENMYVPALAHMPVVHSSILSWGKNEKGIHYGIYFRVNEQDCAKWISDENEARKKLEKSDFPVAYFERDPRHRRDIHGDTGVVFFKFPHEEGFDSGLDGEGSSWMHREDAQKYLQEKNAAQDAGTGCLLQ